MKLTERKLRLVDKTAAELQEDLMESIRTDIRRPWFVLIRVRLLKFLVALEK